MADIETWTRRNYRHNFVVNVLDGMFFWCGASFIAPRTILPLYVSHFTDSKMVIGLLSAINGMGWLLPQLFTAHWVQQVPLKKAIVSRVGLFSERLPLFLMAASALLATRAPTVALVAFFIFLTWHIVGAGTIAVAWQDMIARVIPLERRGLFFGMANFSGTATGVLGASAAAWLLDRYEFPTGYVLCFSIAAVLIFFSWIAVSLTREQPQVGKPLSDSWLDFWRRLPAVLRADGNFRNYLLCRAVIATSTMAIGFYTVYAVQRWRLSDGQAGAFVAPMLIGQSLGNLTFGPLADRRGHKLVLEIGIALGCAGLLMAILAPSPFWFYGVFSLLGGMYAAFMISGLMITLEFCAPDMRPVYIGLNNTTYGIASGIAPLIGGRLAETIGYRPLFGVSLLIGLLGLAAFHFAVRDPRQVAAQAGR